MAVFLVTGLSFASAQAEVTSVKSIHDIRDYYEDAIVGNPKLDFLLERGHEEQLISKAVWKFQGAFKDDLDLFNSVWYDKPLIEKLAKAKGQKAIKEIVSVNVSKLKSQSASHVKSLKKAMKSDIEKLKDEFKADELAGVRVDENILEAEILKLKNEFLFASAEVMAFYQEIIDQYEEIIVDDVIFPGMVPFLLK